MAGEIEIERRGDRATRRLVIVLMALSVIVMGITPLVTIFAFRMMRGKAVGLSAAKPLKQEICLPAVQVNIADTNATRYAQIEVVVEVTDKQMVKFFQERDEDSNPLGMRKRVLSRILGIAGDKPLNSLLPTEGKEKLASEIKAALNDMLSEEATGMVSDVFFYSFLIQ